MEIHQRQETNLPSQRSSKPSQLLVNVHRSFFDTFVSERKSKCHKPIDIESNKINMTKLLPHPVP